MAGHHHHRHHHHHHPPPPPRGGFLSWLFGRPPPPPHPHPHHHHDHHHPHLHHGPPHRRSPQPPIHAADPSGWKKTGKVLSGACSPRTASHQTSTLSWIWSLRWRRNSTTIRTATATPRTTDMDRMRTRTAMDRDGAHTHDHHPHHHHHDHEREGPTRTSNTDPTHTTMARTMAHTTTTRPAPAPTSPIGIAAVLSLLLLVLFGLWELRLERVHSRPGGALYSSPPASKSRSTSRLASNPASSAPPWRTRPRPPPPSLFARRRGRLGVIYLIALLQFAAFMIWAFWVQLYYQVYIGYSPVRTVVRLVPMFVTGLLCNVLVALLVGRVRIVWLLAGGTLTTMVAPLLFALVVPAAPYWAYGFPAAVCSVVGVDFLFAAGMMFVADSVAPGEMSVAGGVFQTMTQLGTSFGVTASTIVFNHVQQIAYRTQARAGLVPRRDVDGRGLCPSRGVEKHSGPQA
ncbi:hypothetical protein B0H14DRAFT_2782456 [Mycena olivaceomarginata]|nr:hypothetical protein B0H14DRAFT_2782456 [Mycena olivaceomarginata]